LGIFIKVIVSYEIKNQTKKALEEQKTSYIEATKEEIEKISKK